MSPHTSPIIPRTHKAQSDKCYSESAVRCMYYVMALIRLVEESYDQTSNELQSQFCRRYVVILCAPMLVLEFHDRTKHRATSVIRNMQDIVSIM